MNKLKFKLISNDEELINEEVNYFIKEETITFKIKEDLYQYDKEKIILIKKDKEKELVINFKDLVIIITMHKENIKFDYPMSNAITKITEKSVNLEYTLDSGEKLNNRICIEF